MNGVGNTKKKRGNLSRIDLVAASGTTSLTALASTTKKWVLRSITLLALSDTAIDVYFKTEDDADTVTLGTKTGKVMTLDRDGGDGPPGFVSAIDDFGLAKGSTAGKELQIVTDGDVGVYGTYYEET